MMITIIPMAQLNSTDSWGTWLELDLTPPSGLCSPTVTGPYWQVYSVLVCFISLLEQSPPENVCCYYYYYYHHHHHHHHHLSYWELNKGAIQKKKRRTKKEKKAPHTLSLPKSNLLYRKNLDLNLCNNNIYIYIYIYIYILHYGESAFLLTLYLRPNAFRLTPSSGV